jgi:assimilatory nitrate reductase catalytic subunit
MAPVGRVRAAPTARIPLETPTVRAPRPTPSVAGTCLEVTPRTDVATNAGGLCQKGWTSADLLTGSGRLTTPLARAHKNGPLLPVSWDDALDQAAEGIRAAQKIGGPDAVAVFGGGGLTNEKAYAVGKFARVALRTSPGSARPAVCSW